MIPAGHDKTYTAIKRKITMSDINSRDDIENTTENDNVVTLESILAEFKGSAFIAGEKKTSPQLLDERTKRIINEAKEGNVAGEELYTEETKDDDFFADIREGEQENSKAPAPEQDIPVVETLSEDDKKLALKTAKVDWQPVKAANGFDEAISEAQAFFAKRDEAVKNREEELLQQRREERIMAEKRRQEPEPAKSKEAPEKEEAEADHQSEKADENSGKEAEKSRKTEILFFDNYRFADSDEGETAAKRDDYSSEYDKWEDEEFEEDGEYSPRKGVFASVLKNLFRTKAAPDIEEPEEDQPEEEKAEYKPEPQPEVYIEEPDFAEESARLGIKCKRLMLKSRIGMVIALVMGIFTVLYERGVNLPLIGDPKLFTAVLVIMQLIVMMLSLEILRRGLRDLLHREPGAETLVLFSNLATYVACCRNIVSGKEGMGTPFCAVAAFSCAFSMWGEYRALGAMRLSLKTASSSEAPQVLTCEYEKSIDRTIVKRHLNGQAGFYNNLVEADISELTYKYFAPFIIAAAVLLAAVSAIGGKCDFIHCLSAIAASCASFTALSAFALPFSNIAKRLRKDGSAVAGWGGADDIYYADGVRITDSDVFPGGVTITGIKVAEGLKSDKVIRYAASVMMATGSDLAPAFSDYLNRQGLAEARLDSFDCAEGGVCAVIRGERVICGTSACMTLFGIRIPQSMNIKNAMFVAINDTVSGAFTMGYAPSRLVQTSLLTMLRSRIKLYFAVRDFNITPLLVQQKLQIPVDDIEYMTAKDAYEISEDKPAEVPHAAAVMLRDITSAFADTVACARKLRSTAVINTAVSVLTTVLGMVIMFFMCWKGNAESVSPVNLTEYMLAMEAVIIIISQTTGLI